MGSRLYLDTEFNGHRGELISLALVPSDAGQASFYEVLDIQERAATEGRVLDPWVVEHVLPVLGRAPQRPSVFRSMFQHYLLSYYNPEIICDWPGDIVHFCNLLQGPDYMQSLDYPMMFKLIRTPPGEPVPATPHNALSDAIALRDWYEANHVREGDENQNIFEVAAMARAAGRSGC